MTLPRIRAGRMRIVRDAALSFVVILAAACPALAQGATFTGFDAAADPGRFPPEGDGRRSPVPRAEAAFLDGKPVTVDGRLDDPVWSDAPAAGGFLVWDPDRGKLPSEETIFKVAYDRDAVYFAVACLENDPSRISVNLSRRDRFSNSDLVSVYIDPYHDRTTGYNFKVNPLGVQMDSYVYNDGEMDQDWDAVWEAETYRDERGWYVEIRIPFSAVRYRPSEDMTWGLQVYRYMHGRGEDTAWVTWDRETPGFVSRFGELTGLRNVPSPRQLEILPYLVARAADPAATGSEDTVDHLQKLGADLKYGATADLTLNATVQPDFGQVEADPAVLNLSPFETFFQEKRPFFIEGAKFFEHPDFNLFYSRRIGTGDENARIRLAGKLTGKTSGGFSVGALAATTDITANGRAHNLFTKGSLPAHYFVTRLGKEFDRGNHRIHLTGTAALKTTSRESLEDPGGGEADRASREAYTGGVDFEFHLRNRDYRLHGSVVGSEIHPETYRQDSVVVAPARTYGTGGHLEFMKQGGDWRGSVFGRWESDRLDLNDLGYIQAPDEIVAGLWVGYRYNPEGRSSLFNHADINYNAGNSWIYGERSGRDVVSGDVAWSYGPGHPQRFNTNINGYGQFKNYWGAWFGVEAMPWSTQRYETRGGPLMSEPGSLGGWLGGSTDSRQKLVVETELVHFRDVAENHESHANVSLRWNQSSALTHQIGLGCQIRRDDTQYLETLDLRERPGGVGIGGLSYVFGKIHQQTYDVTLRSNILFSRNHSLEIYAQPFLSVGNYTGARELAAPDTYDFVAYTEPGYLVEANDFTYTSVNLNVVYRWEYRPGSTVFLVWTQGREGYEERGYGPGTGFSDSRRAGAVFSTEPANTFLVKVSYWLPI